MKRIVLLITFISLLIAAVNAYSIDASRDLENNLIRLHILAESNSDYDQSIKLAVRDRILAAVNGISVKDTAEFVKVAETAANDYLETNNIPYRARAEYGRFIFPEKEYKNITLPAGEYRGVRVILGSGSGHNWWCVMYPPLCVSGKDAYADRGAQSELKNLLRKDTYDVISSDSSENRISLRIIDFINSLR